MVQRLLYLDDVGADTRAARSGETVTNFRDFLTVNEAAQLLGVSKSTLRNWERRGKVLAHRHPINRYRLFRRAELERILEQTLEPTAARDGGGEPR